MRIHYPQLQKASKSRAFFIKSHSTSPHTHLYAIDCHHHSYYPLPPYHLFHHHHFHMEKLSRSLVVHMKGTTRCEAEISRRILSAMQDRALEGYHQVKPYSLLHLFNLYFRSIILIVFISVFPIRVGLCVSFDCF